MSLQGCIVQLLLAYGTHIHEACSSALALAYLVTQNLFSPLLGCKNMYVANVRSSSHWAMMRASDQLHTANLCSPQVSGNRALGRPTVH
jgi:hypothetical protein